MRERGLRPPEVTELQNQIKTVRDAMHEAIGRSDFAAAKALSDEEGAVRERLFLLYRENGLLDWIFDQVL